MIAAALSRISTAWRLWRRKFRLVSAFAFTLRQTHQSSGGRIQLFEIGQILQPAAGSLVGLEVVESDDIQPDGAEFDLFSPGKAGFEINPVDGGQQIDSAWRLPELYHCVGSEVFDLQPD